MYFRRIFRDIRKGFLNVWRGTIFNILRYKNPSRKEIKISVEVTILCLIVISFTILLAYWIPKLDWIVRIFKISDISIGLGLLSVIIAIFLYKMSEKTTNNILEFLRSYVHPISQVYCEAKNILKELDADDSSIFLCALSSPILWHEEFEGEKIRKNEFYWLLEKRIKKGMKTICVFLDFTEAVYGKKERLLETPLGEFYVTLCKYKNINLEKARIFCKQALDYMEILLSEAGISRNVIIKTRETIPFQIIIGYGAKLRKAVIFFSNVDALRIKQETCGYITENLDDIENLAGNEFVKIYEEPSFENNEPSFIQFSNIVKWDKFSGVSNTRLLIQHSICALIRRLQTNNYDLEQISQEYIEKRIDLEKVLNNGAKPDFSKRFYFNPLRFWPIQMLQDIQYKDIIESGNALIKFLFSKKENNEKYIVGKNILEIGTGTGLVSLLSLLGKAKKVITLDKDEKALEIAQRNYDEYKEEIDLKNNLTKHELSLEKYFDSFDKYKDEIKEVETIIVDLPFIPVVYKPQDYLLKIERPYFDAVSKFRILGIKEETLLPLSIGNFLEYYSKLEILRKKDIFITFSSIGKENLERYLDKATIYFKKENKTEFDYESTSIMTQKDANFSIFVYYLFPLGI